MNGGNWLFELIAPGGYSMSNLIIDDFGNANISFMRLDSDVYTDRNLYFATGTSEPIPEPTTMLLLGSGLAGLAAFKRKSKKK